MRNIENSHSCPTEYLSTQTKYFVDLQAAREHYQDTIEVRQETSQSTVLQDQKKEQQKLCFQKISPKHQKRKKSFSRRIHFVSLRQIVVTEKAQTCMVEPIFITLVPLI